MQSYGCPKNYRKFAHKGLIRSCAEIFLIYFLMFIASGCTHLGVVDKESEVTDFHGFHIDAHQITESQKSSVLPTVFEQLKIVESVGLPDNVLSYFRKIPLIIDPALKKQPGMYSANGALGVVRIHPFPLPNDKAILLHEFLHAFHINILTVKNAEILVAYKNAILADDYPTRFRSAHFLSSPGEYFAVTGTIYLFGRIQQPPFDCAVMAKTQPDYLAFLAKEFGEHTCRELM